MKFNVPKYRYTGISSRTKVIPLAQDGMENVNVFQVNVTTQFNKKW